MTSSPGDTDAAEALKKGPAAAAEHVDHQRNKSVAMARKVGVTVLGGLVLATGVAMMVLPGPGLIVIVLGLFILSLEFEWASKRLDQAKEKALDAAHKTAASPAQTAVALLSAAALVGGGIYWGMNKDLPASSWWTAGTLIFSGVAAAATVLWSVQDLKKRNGARKS
jgi:uncharacterized protein (TIGR02611 family)